MDLSFEPEIESYRRTVAAILDHQMPAGWSGLGSLDRGASDRFAIEWREILYENGMLAVHWPIEYGGQGLSWGHNAVLIEELAKRGLPFGGRNDDFGIRMVGNTILACGSEQQKRTFLHRIVSGQDRWCQGFSEPGAGSDLAGVACRARLQEDQWLIDGQKVWTSAATSANWIFLLVRTSDELSAHARLSFLLAPMDQPGVTVRPIATMTGEVEFSEVFFDGAKTAGGNVVGEVGGGWRVAMSLLGWERGESAVAYPIRFRDELNRLIVLARQRGALSDRCVRRRLARCHVKTTVMEALGRRMLSDFLHGATPGAESSVFKLYWSEYHHEATRLALDILGREGLAPTGRRSASVVYPTDDVGAPNDTWSWLDTWMNAHAATIYAGSSEVQRTIIAERLLGLPKEPRQQSATVR